MKQTMRAKQSLTFRRANLASQLSHLSQSTRRFLRGLLVFVLALGSLFALSAGGESNYTGAYFAGKGSGFSGCGNVSQSLSLPANVRGSAALTRGPKVRG